MSRRRLYLLAAILTVAFGFGIGLLSRWAWGVAAGTPEVEVRSAN